MTSDKQIAANRRNGRKSQGPKTAEGKVSASLNATKHGILSRQVLIHTGREEADENLEAFIALLDSLCDEFKPVGAMEELLVDRLLSTVWRLKRLLMAETGHVLRRIESHQFHTFLDRLERHGAARQNPQTSFFVRLKTSMGCNEMADTMEHIAQALKEHGKFPWPEWIPGILEKRFGAREGFFRTEVLRTIDYYFQHPDEHKTEELEKKSLEDAIREAEALAKWFKGMGEIIEWIEKDEEKADLKAKMVPSLEELDKLQRYEAHLQRIFTQTLHELQRVQAARLGRTPPMSAALDVTLNAENGFVS